MDDTGDLPKAVKVAAPAVGCDFTMALNAGAQMRLQTFMPLDAPSAEWDEAIDKMRLAAVRQRAIFELPELLSELERINRGYADREAAIVKTRDAVEQKRIELHNAREFAEKAWNDERSKYVRKWEMSGRHGDYKAAGAEKSALDQLWSQILAADKALEDFAQEIANGEVTFDAQTVEWNRNKAEVEKKIAEAQKAISGG